METGEQNSLSEVQNETLKAGSHRCRAGCVVCDISFLSVNVDYKGRSRIGLHWGIFFFLFALVEHCELNNSLLALKKKIQPKTLNKPLPLLLCGSAKLSSLLGPGSFCPLDAEWAGAFEWARHRSIGDGSSDIRDVLSGMCRISRGWSIARYLFSRPA